MENQEKTPSHTKENQEKESFLEKMSALDDKFGEFINNWEKKFEENPPKAISELQTQLMTINSKLWDAYDLLSFNLGDRGIDRKKDKKNNEELDELRITIQNKMPNLISFVNGSPFCQRITEWPEGPGDWETINAIVDQEVMVKKNGNPVYFWEKFLVSQLPITKQHREKLKIQSKIAEEVIKNNGENAGIISIGCGGCRDLEYIQDKLKDRKAKLYLVDHNNNALRDANNRLNRIDDNNKSLINKNVIEFIRGLDKNDDQVDWKNVKMIYAGGLFDYLDDKTINFILDKIKNKVQNFRGENDDQTVKILFTNIRDSNPFQPFMEFILNWRLIGRDKKRMEGILNSLEKNESDGKLYTEPTGLTWIAEISI
ncbi:MAG: hypothetical protein GF335_02240 [Candidatus Moranbacteria bacterium]|nr:hypothetical protein [Candidatus Moranbacteria bacterium]